MIQLAVWLLIIVTYTSQLNHSHYFCLSCKLVIVLNSRFCNDFRKYLILGKLPLKLTTIIFTNRKKCPRHAIKEEGGKGGTEQDSQTQTFIRFRRYKEANREIKEIGECI